MKLIPNFKDIKKVFPTNKIDFSLQEVTWPNLDIFDILSRHKLTTILPVKASCCCNWSFKRIAAPNFLREQLEMINLRWITNNFNHSFWISNDIIGLALDSSSGIWHACLKGNCHFQSIWCPGRRCFPQL